ncbi:MAG TPA: ABC transporter ATP-binding protein [Acidimicrobiales bacterium]|nr:ABC transporter ATP-binding protein [Acidimicrobiales bacterium]
MERVVSADVKESVAISLDHVTKIYRGGGGIHELSLDINVGEVFGFLGPNGAGKTTTIRLILDLIRPSAGRISVFGLDARADSVAIRRRLGYLPGELALYERLSARQILTHFAHLRGGLDWSRVQHYVDAFDLDVDRPVRSLSRGNRQKVGLVAAMMGDPEFLVLDEPTSGLDPLVQRRVQEEVRRAAREGRTVLLSSHVLSEVGEMADRVGLIRDGRLIAIEAVAQLQQRSAHLVEARFREPTDFEVFIALPGVTSHSVDGRTLHLEVAGDLNPIVALLARHVLDDLSIREPTLEELFMRFYGAPSE